MTFSIWSCCFRRNGSASGVSYTDLSSFATAYSVVKVKWNEPGCSWLFFMNPIFSIPLLYVCVCVGSPQLQPAWWTCAATLWMSKTAPWRSKAVSTVVPDNQLSRPHVHVELNRSHVHMRLWNLVLKTVCRARWRQGRGKVDKAACKMLRKADEISRDTHREEEHH